MAEPLWLCRTADLIEKGPAWVFDVSQYGQSVRAFALRHEGRVVAYLNRCAHVPTEMDWQPGQFLDSEQRFILCSIHGASYDPQSGQCVGGPCGRGRLTALQTLEQGEQVYWYPSQGIEAPAFEDAPSAAAAQQQPDRTRSDE